MSTVEMRKFVRDRYDGDKWKKRVIKMSDKQIVALYFRFAYEDYNVKTGKCVNK